ncbi:MAG: CRISPR-associated endoribonuclease Cas6 [Thermoproteota archaeon]
MRVRINLRGRSKDLSFPLSYNPLIQAAIYSNVSPELSKFLHDKGFTYEKRHFKLFTFSRLFGKYKIIGDRIYFEQEVSFFISSPVDQVVKEIAETLLKRGFLALGQNKLEVTNIYFPKTPELKNRIKIKMLSPVTVYSTLLTPDGKKKTYYYSPFEDEFQNLIDLNAKKKYFLLSHREVKSRIRIEPEKVREVVVMYKDMVIKGWTGLFGLRGPKTLIKTVYEAGLGSKNPQGFGMFDLVK